MAPHHHLHWPRRVTLWYIVKFIFNVTLFFNANLSILWRLRWHVGTTSPPTSTTSLRHVIRDILISYYFLFNANVSILWRQRWHVGTASPPTFTTSLRRVIRDILVSFFLLLSFLMLIFLFYDDYDMLAPHHYPHPLRRVIRDILVSFFLLLSFLMLIFLFYDNYDSDDSEGGRGWYVVDTIY
jgi:hypothetical protein